MSQEHHPTIKAVNRAFIVGIGLNLAYVVIEFAVGLWSDSMGLLSDAGHNLSDVAALLLVMLAFRLAHARATSRYTFGYKKSTVLISLFNSGILLIAVGIIVVESIQRMFNPVPIEGGAIAWTAGAGILVNGFTAWLFMRNQGQDLNVRGAYLHMLADTLGSAGVVGSGLLISWTGWTIIDPIVGLVVAGVIVGSVWSLTRESLRLSLDGVPKGICVDDLRRRIASVEHVEAVDHLHVWALSTTENALTAHIFVCDMEHMCTVKSQVRELLAESGIEHVTLEFEFPGSDCARGCSSYLHLS